MRNLRFFVVNVVLFTTLYCLWALGLFNGISESFTEKELIIWGLLTAYSIPGFVAVYRENFDLARHILHGIPMVALLGTVAGMIISVAGVTTLSPEVILGVFKNLIFSISANLIGMFLFVWMRELAFHSSKEVL